MRLVAVSLLTISQFTAFPFLAIVSANSARHSEEVRIVRNAELPHVTTVYKTQGLRTAEM